MSTYTNEQYVALAEWLGHTIKYNWALGHYVFMSSSNWTKDGISWNDYKKYLKSEKGRITIENKFIAIGGEYWVKKSNSIYVVKELRYSPVGGHFDTEKEEITCCYGKTIEEAWINLVFLQIEQKERKEEFKERDRLFNEKYEAEIKKHKKAFELKYEEKYKALLESLEKVNNLKVEKEEY